MSRSFEPSCLVHPYRAGPFRERPSFAGMLVSMRRGRPVIVNTVDIAWSSIGLVLDVRIGRQGFEGGGHEDALVLFPEGLVRVEEKYLQSIELGA